MSTARYSYRAYPTKGEAKAGRRLLGCCRVVFNDTIRQARAARARGEKYPGAVVLQRRVLTDGKQHPDRAFLRDVCGVALIQALRDADLAYRNYFKSLTGERRGRKLGSPRLRSRRDHRQTARFTRAARFRVSDLGDGWGAVRLSGIGDVRFVLSRPLPSDLSSVTLIHDADGRWHVSFVVERPVEHGPSPKPRTVCGVDVGLKDFATVLTVDLETRQETVEKIKTPMFLRRRLRALKRSQRSLSRKQNGSRNRERQRVRVAARHRKVRDARADHAHQLAARLTATHDLIVTEDLAVTGFMRNRRLARSASDQGLGMFLRHVQHHAHKQGHTHHRIGRFIASTQACSCCARRTGPKGLDQLGVRQWVCSGCEATHDRDVNAARNILHQGLLDLGLALTTHAAVGLTEALNARGGTVRRARFGEHARPSETGRITGEAVPT